MCLSLFCGDKESNTLLVHIVRDNHLVKLFSASIQTMLFNVKYCHGQCQTVCYGKNSNDNAEMGYKVWGSKQFAKDTDPSHSLSFLRKV